ncbi:MAG: plasmid pRiA4b ORF-3 family protein [Actinoallomurus sp.]
MVKVLMGWSDYHLHVFSVGRHRYADEFHRLEGTRPEHLTRLHQALPAPKATISYVYDLGDCWRHEILLERVLDQHLPHPECTAGQGDNPIEDYNPEFPEEPVPFDREVVNTALRRL